MVATRLMSLWLWMDREQLPCDLLTLAAMVYVIHVATRRSGISLSDVEKITELAESQLGERFERLFINMIK